VALNVIVDIALVLQSHFFAMQIFISFNFSLAARKVKKGFAQPVFEARLAKHTHTHTHYFFLFCPAAAKQTLIKMTAANLHTQTQEVFKKMKTASI